MVVMTTPKVNFSKSTPAISKNTAVIIGVETAGKSIKLTKSRFDSLLPKDLALDSLGISAELGKVAKLPGPKGAVIALVGLGDKISTDSLREATGAAVRELGSLAELIVDLPTKNFEQLLAIFEGALLGNYEFLSYKPKATARALKAITIIGEKPTAKSLREIEFLAQAVKACRDLVNHPANELYPEVMVNQAKKEIKNLPIKLKVWDEKQLVAEGLGGIHAVGKGSNRPPRLVKLEYKPTRAKKSIALVGKGITFDTGGLSLKPAESMVGMKYDMTGAAAVMQALVAIAKHGLKIRATAWLCLAENMPSGGATRPNDVIRIRNGKTVEVLNTDAEGRLVLADGLSMASEEKPDYIVDVATLTGAATIALGNRYAGLMGDDALVKRISEAAKEVGELVWPMPLPQELRPLLNSDIADIANVKIGNRAGGMLVGGIFLREFVGSENHTPAWAHLDIAGPANNDGAAYGYTPKGATGVMVRTLVNLAKSLV